MSVLLVQNRKVQVDWLGLQSHTRTIGACVICFALGGWVARISDRSADIPYEHRSTAQLQQIQKVVGPSKNPVATVDCLERKAAVATTAAKQNATAAQTDADVPVINPNVIPNCAPTLARK